MATYSIEVSYDGKPFCGFARQPGQLTIQGEIEHALQLLFRREVEIACAGRTDAGVHALRQVVSFDIGEDELAGRSEPSILRSLNALVHDGISVRSIDRRPDGFSARFDAKSRTYRYFISTAPTPPLFMQGFSWHVGKPLHVESMREAAAHLIGEHDFKSFCIAASAKGRRTYRNVFRIDIFEQEALSGSGEVLLCMEVEGNAFLHSMVRSIVGSLVLVGKGKRDPEWMEEVLQARDRKAAGENAPAAGLVLWKVSY